MEANALKQLGYQAEAATWRNEYLVGAAELRKTIAVPKYTETASPDMISAMTIPQFFDNLSIHLNPEKANGIDAIVNWTFPDVKQKYTTILHNSVLRYETSLSKKADFNITMHKSELVEVLLGKRALKDIINSKSFSGDKTKFQNMAAYFDKFDPAFNIIEP